MRPLIRSMLLGAVALMIAVPGTAGAATIFADDFNRPNSTNVGNGWTESEDGRWDVRITDNRLRLRDVDDDPSVTQRSIDTTGFENINIRFDYQSYDGTETYDTLSVLFDSGSGLTVLANIALGNDDEWMEADIDLPDSAADNSDLTARIALWVSNDDEAVYINNFVVSGDPIGAGGGGGGSAIPEPSAALVFSTGMIAMSLGVRRRASLPGP